MNLRSLVINGTDHVEEHTFEVNGGEVTVAIRPLSDGEIHRINTTQQEANVIKGNPVTKKFENVVSISKQLEAKYKGDLLTCELGIVDTPKWTQEDLKKLPAGLPSAIAQKILEISGATKKKEDSKVEENNEVVQQLESFRENN
ncbi:hypothetical protein [Cytobacillus sp. NCCP-133]|uniref:hypothetical protein n=1 Tax=Cytobacillus sp. NCCP-133 TaxID=766848 RepID=UPI0022327A02|nr:hypothetical protein [Cytobacillus sp. NCCP-133]GLB58677.1 hypothetical protein NCCP133_08100 [Cytobacillus sp. NCCP-133]